MGLGYEAGVAAGNVIVALFAALACGRVGMMLGTFGDTQDAGRTRASALLHLALFADLLLICAVGIYYAAARLAMPELWQSWLALSTLRLMVLITIGITTFSWWTWTGRERSRALTLTMREVGGAVAAWGALAWSLA